MFSNIGAVKMHPDTLDLQPILLVIQAWRNMYTMTAEDVGGTHLAFICKLSTAKLISS